MNQPTYKMACPACGAQMMWLSSRDAAGDDFWCCPACGEELAGLRLVLRRVWLAIKGAL